MSDLMKCKEDPQHVVATVYYTTGVTTSAKLPAQGLLTKFELEFREELAHWFCVFPPAYKILPEQVFLELREGSQHDSSGAAITVVITGKVWDERERKLKIALKEIHDYLRGHPLYQASLLVRIQMGGVFLQIQSPGEDYDRDKKPIERHWSASSQ